MKWHQQNSEETFMFTIATNGYDEIYADYLESHRSYASKFGYRYIAFTKSPLGGISGTNSAWMKVAIIVKALQKGYKNIFFIDSDALIRDYSPPIKSVFCTGKAIYMSVESSGNFNSGVIIVENTRESLRFFQALLLRADVPGFLLPKSDRCLYENGHVINLAKNSPIVQVIDPKWNYNFFTDLPSGEQEYIWHGRDTWHKKPRSQQAKMTLFQTFIKRISEGGSRYFLLRRILKFYESEYIF